MVRYDDTAFRKMRDSGQALGYDPGAFAVTRSDLAFTIAPAVRQPTIRWVNDAGGQWSTASNWLDVATNAQQLPAIVARHAVRLCAGDGRQPRAGGVQCLHPLGAELPSVPEGLDACNLLGVHLILTAPCREVSPMHG